jgi:hypothetical protein
MKGKRDTVLQKVVKELKDFGVDVEIDYVTGEIVGVSIPYK